MHASLARSNMAIRGSQRGPGGLDDLVDDRLTAMAQGRVRALGDIASRAVRGLGAAGRAIGARPFVFIGVTALIVALSAMLPPLLLSVARKPWTYFAFNPWLKRLPEYLVFDRPAVQRLDFLARFSLFWLSADGAYGAPEWGFAVDSLDLARMAVTGMLTAAYVCLLLALRRDGLRTRAPGPAGRTGGTLGAMAVILGLSSGPCSVVGCGAPVLPVVGLAFA